ncbi:tRNA m(1)G methyltransferase Trm10 [Hyaloraphidium curvatum]|nr:tRNA m(1)G methyltransferase Trm10 [Hyaloraphidium curvatum]
MDEPGPETRLDSAEGFQSSDNAAAGHKGSNPGEPGEQQQQLSKNARKRLLKEQRWLATRDERKKILKEKDRVREAKRKAERAQLAAQGGLANVVKKPPPTPSKARVVIDCDFEELMTENELQSMSKQIAICYSKNRAARHPMQLAATSLKGVLEANLDRRQPHWKSWKMNCDPRHYLDVFPDAREKAVYLTADSPNTIEEIEEDKIYIIGGIVDKNRHKMLCYNRALEQGIAHGRLKIDSYIQMKGRPVLTVDQVFEIVSQWLEVRDWEAAFWKAIPQRKGLTAKDSGESTAVGDVEASRGADESCGGTEDRPLASGAADGGSEGLNGT